jgi:hypothetical protein
MTGTEMAAIATFEIEPGWQIYCTETSGGFNQGTTYVRNEDNTGFDAIETVSATDAVDDLINEFSTIHQGELLAPTLEEFNRYTASGATITYDSNNGLQLNTNTTLNGNATIEKAGVSLSFANKSSFQVKLRVLHNTNFTRARVGIGAELASEANITTVRKYGFEGCSSSGVNWLIFSASATNRSTLSTASPVLTAAHTSYRCTYDMADVTLRVGTTDVGVKTSDLPASFRTASQFFRAGIQNTAAENKQMYLAGLRWAGTILDTGWV